MPYDDRNRWRRPHRPGPWRVEPPRSTACVTRRAGRTARGRDRSPVPVAAPPTGVSRSLTSRSSRPPEPPRQPPPWPRRGRRTGRAAE
ncbi:hypothetical protein F3L20_19025 [Streptomyces tendae]|uniref:Uncharacterized protein n=1 Tax=Streptomyces tendae TaxID=1932 RepID=A0ABX5ZTB4_STRTE|nr:hypothetical protein F3L20_19025 [Streptomyces tendae]